MSSLRACALVALLLPTLAIAESLPAVRSFMSYDGTAVDAKSGQFLYRESHFVALEGDAVRERLVLYRCQDGAPFARKRVASVLDTPWLPEFDMVDARLDYREGLDASGSVPEVYFKAVGKDETKRSEIRKPPSDLVGDAGFDRFVQDHWDRLLAGESLRLNFLVPSRLEYLGFRVKRLRADQFQGRPTEVFRLALGGFIGLFVSGIDVHYDAEQRLLMRFEGLSNVRGLNGDNYVARIEFPLDERREEANAESFESARTMQLAQSCAPARG